MKKMSETIVFFGSGPVAAASLELLAQDFTVEAVVTKPQPPHHKVAFPVLSLSEKLDLKVLTANTKQELANLFVDNSLTSRLGVIIDHGLIVPQDVIDYFPLGIVNSHFSLLPRWRGADPISFAILNGDHKTGVSLMRIVEKLDEGELLAQRSLTLSPDINTPGLTADLIKLSHDLLVETLPTYIKGGVRLFPQTGEPSYSRKLSKQDGVIDWQKPAVQLEREVRAFSGWPRSRTTLGGVDVIITQVHVTSDQGVVGQTWTDNKLLGVYTQTGSLVIDELIPAGKKPMSAVAFMAGYKV